jgi:hypothetical protein
MSWAAAPLILADHPMITAVPFFVPALGVAAVVGTVIWRDRRRSRQEEAGADDDG